MASSKQTMVTLILLVLFFFEMVSADPEIVLDFSPTFIVYTNGKVEGLMSDNKENVAAGLDNTTNVESKDVVYSDSYNLSARIYIPKDNLNKNEELPLLVYFHGGAFMFGSPFTKLYHTCVNSLVSEAKVIAVSVDYRKARMHPVPSAHQDSWTALKWVASHVNGKGPEHWLNTYADFQKVFLSGDSAGANIAHHMGIKHGQERLEGVNIDGIISFFPFFWGRAPVLSETRFPITRNAVDSLWKYVCPNTTSSDDPWINPAFDPSLRSLGCSRVLVVVGEKDVLRCRGLYYVQKLKESGWNGQTEILDIEKENHVFHLVKPTSANATMMLNRTSSFIHHLDNFRA